jgi:hypothetical protein
MYVPAQTNNADWRALCNCRFATSYEHDLGRVAIVKHALLREINRDMALQQAARRNLHALAVVHDPSRIRGGNWKMQGFRRSGPVYDVAEGEMSIAEFMADKQERDDIVD